MRLPMRKAEAEAEAKAEAPVDKAQIVKFLIGCRN